MEVIYLALDQALQSLEELDKIGLKFGKAKQGYELRCCRYLSRLGFAIQLLLTAIMLNLKRSPTEAIIIVLKYSVQKTI